MVKGALRKNKRNKRSYYPEEKKIKILSGDNISFDRINSMVNTGCLVILYGVEENRKGLVYQSSDKDKTVYVAFKPDTPNYFEDARLRFNSKDNYEISSKNYIALKPEYPSFYKELNKKLEKIL